MNRLLVEDLSKRFGPRKLFAHLNFELATGESLAVVGPNGAGKTTLLMTLLGLQRPTGGRVHYLEGNESLSDVDRRLGVALVAPYLQLYDQLTGEENLKFLVSVSGAAVTGKRINEILDRVGLAGRGGDPTGAYSSGMKQRLKYAVALSCRPSYLFLDEPWANLDADGRQRVSDLIGQVRSETVLVVATSDAEEAGLASEQLRLG